MTINVTSQYNTILTINKGMENISYQVNKTIKNEGNKTQSV